MSKPTNYAAMKALYEKSPYDVTTATSLEQYVLLQMTDGKYDFEANRILLKLYQCYPEISKAETIANILVLSLMRLPSTDFLLLSYLIPLKFSSNIKIKFIQKCADFLESGRFKEFWDSCVDGTVAEITMNANFRNAIRSYMMGNIRSTFRNMSRDQFQQMLGLESAELESFCSSCTDVKQVTADTVIIVPPVDTLGKSKALEESVRFEEILRLTETMRS
eukprot:gene559-1075_t